MARFAIVPLAICLIVGLIGAGCSNTPGTKITDDDLKIWRNTPSPNGRFRIVIYQHDTGALGYGRIFWAITPENLDGVDLTKFKLPDGYRAEGWTNEGELEISRWQPYYGIRDSRRIQAGDLINGITVKMVENSSTYALPGYEEPKGYR